MRLRLFLYSVDGQVLSRETVELPALPEIGTVIRPPLVSIDCFVTRAVPASIEETGDIRIAGTVYADALGSLAVRDDQS